MTELNWSLQGREIILFFLIFLVLFLRYVFCPLFSRYQSLFLLLESLLFKLSFWNCEHSNTEVVKYEYVRVLFRKGAGRVLRGNHDEGLTLKKRKAEWKERQTETETERMISAWHLVGLILNFKKNMKKRERSLKRLFLKVKGMELTGSLHSSPFYERQATLTIRTQIVIVGKWH